MSMLAVFSNCSPSFLRPGLSLRDLSQFGISQFMGVLRIELQPSAGGLSPQSHRVAFFFFDRVPLCSPGVLELAL